MRGINPNGTRIRKLRKTRGLTQAALASAAACDAKTVRNAESGRRIDVSTLDRIARALQIELAELVAADHESVAEATGQYVVHAIDALGKQDIASLADQFVESAQLNFAIRYRAPWAGQFVGRREICQWADALCDTFHFRTLYVSHLLPCEDFVSAHVALQLLPRQSARSLDGVTFLITAIASVKGIQTCWMYPESGAIEQALNL